MKHRGAAAFLIGLALACGLSSAQQTISPTVIRLANNHIIVGQSGGTGGDVPLSGDATITNAGVFSLGPTVAGDISFAGGIDSTTIGANTAAAGTFTTIGASDIAVSDRAAVVGSLSTQSPLSVLGTLPSTVTNATAYGIASDISYTTTQTGGMIALYGRVRSVAAGGATTVASADAARADTPVLGTNWTATAIRGVHVMNQGSARGTTAYGVYVENQSGSTNNYAFVSAGASNNSGFGVTTPTALVTLGAGAAGANRSPLKFTTGTLQTVAEAGAVEYDGNQLYITPSSATRTQIMAGFSGTTGSIGGSALLAGQCAAGTATVTGATTSMAVAVSPSSDPDSVLTTGIAIYAFVSSANTVTVRVCAIVAVTPASVTYNVRAF